MSHCFSTPSLTSLKIKENEHYWSIIDSTRINGRMKAPWDPKHTEFCLLPWYIIVQTIFTRSTLVSFFLVAKFCILLCQLKELFLFFPLVFMVVCWIAVAKVSAACSLNWDRFWTPWKRTAGSSKDLFCDQILYVFEDGVENNLLDYKSLTAAMFQCRWQV